jgi:hypothetical protein
MSKTIINCQPLNTLALSMIDMISLRLRASKRQRSTYWNGLSVSCLIRPT